MKVGDYVRTKRGQIHKITDLKGYYENNKLIEDRQYVHIDNHFSGWDLGQFKELIIKSSPNIIDLVEYMDLLWLEHPIKLYDSDTTIGLFNPVRCDGFTEFEDGTHCIILNLDYIVDIKDLKIKGIITHEQIESMEYKIKE